MNKWQPFDTAPKDGSYILAWDQSRRRPVVISWMIDLDLWSVGYGAEYYPDSQDLSHWMLVEPMLGVQNR